MKYILILLLNNGGVKEKNTINLFLRRQDSTGKYYLMNSDENGEFINPLRNYRRYGWSEIDFSGAKYLDEIIDNTCY